jgi:hypothetical protein
MEIDKNEMIVVMELCDLCVKTNGLKTHPNVFMLAQKIGDNLNKTDETKKEKNKK